jgi:hypothetical protein
VAAGAGEVDGAAAARRVEVAAVGHAAVRPALVVPAVPGDPPVARRLRGGRRHHGGQRVEGARLAGWQQLERERVAEDVDVGVGEAGQGAAAGEVDFLRRRAAEGRQLGPRADGGDVPAGQRQRLVRPPAVVARAHDPAGEDQVGPAHLGER